jgi:LPXTG-site transpeptidase (sortase) family protein
VTPTRRSWTVRRHRARRGWWAALVVIIVTVLGGGALGAGSLGAGRLWDGGTRPSVAWRASAPDASAPDMKQGPDPPAPNMPAPIGDPTEVRIPSLGLAAPLVALHLDAAGALAAPADYQVPGWYAEGTPPGDVGPAVIAGHVDSPTGPAVFHRLHELRAGDRVEVARGGRWLAFRVVSASQHAKDQFPTEKVYGPTPDRQLRLITCGGRFDESRLTYRDNVVVFVVAI